MENARHAQQVSGTETNVTGTGTRVSCGARYEIRFSEVERWAQRSSSILSFAFLYF